MLAANTASGSALPSVDGYRDALLVAAAVCVAIIPFCVPVPRPRCAAGSRRPSSRRRPDHAPHLRLRRSRTRLLDAAQALFSERGFDATTTRQIAERADVDAALIARYFGNKAKLYLAAVAAEPDDQPEPTV